MTTLTTLVVQPSCWVIVIKRAREVLGYDPQDNSAYFDGEERVAEGQ